MTSDESVSKTVHLAGGREVLPSHRFLKQSAANRSSTLSAPSQKKLQFVFVFLRRGLVQLNNAFVSIIAFLKTPFQVHPFFAMG